MCFNMTFRGKMPSIEFGEKDKLFRLQDMCEVKPSTTKTTMRATKDLIRAFENMTVSAKKPGIDLDDTYYLFRQQDMCWGEPTSMTRIHTIKDHVCDSSFIAFEYKQQELALDYCISPHAKGYVGVGAFILVFFLVKRPRKCTFYAKRIILCMLRIVTILLTAMIDFAMDFGATPIAFALACLIVWLYFSHW